MPPLTVPLANLTGHNVSGRSNYNKANYPTLFTGKTNHDGTVLSVDSSLDDDSENPAAGNTVAPMNISKLNNGGDSIHALMPANWPGRCINWAVAWWGQSNHPNIGINDRGADMAVILQDAWDRGFDVQICDWYDVNTSGNSVDDTVADNMVRYLPAGMKFAIAINEHYLSRYHTDPAQAQANLISGINHLMDKYAVNAYYERYNGALAAYVGRPLLLFWNIDSAITDIGATVDWAAVRAAVHQNPIFVRYQSSGFSKPQSDGAFFWIDSNADSASDPAGISYITKSQQPAFSNNQNKICIGSVTPGFNGTLTKSTGWSLGKYIARQNGKTWLDWWNTHKTWLINSGKRIDYILSVTWDDYEEGSAIQGGIRTDARISALKSGNIISFSITGSEATIKQYNLWGTTDGVNAIQLATVLPGTAKQFDLTKVSVPADGSYTLYVQAQSYAGLQNHMAASTFVVSLTTNVITPPPVIEPPPPPPPVVSHNPVAVIMANPVSGTVPLNVALDNSNSYSPDAAAGTTIANFRVAWGDGQVTSGLDALPTHVYANPGTYLITLTVTDSRGSVGTATQVIQAVPVVVQPGPGDNVPPGPGQQPPPVTSADPLLNPQPPVTPAPVTTPDPRRVLCQRFRTRFTNKKT
jgi:PKD repeat protein